MKGLRVNISKTKKDMRKIVIERQKKVGHGLCRLTQSL